ncbi:alpha/beta fold hydrolase [uncultured Pseudoteredinibacter sp.]|uniref:alpha/beta fold hydrolase n=1 Tax=uncultured Pseudoteredinibacter sp. TaxID=1641701 RepID=UPI002609B9F6|nr:alpha/beta fold hydrolase [uncultured Pseudoteredinibacter sp.]
MKEQLSRGRDIHFDVFDRVIAAQEWGKPGGRKVLAIHGWLDNSASFAPMSNHLEDVHFIALDTAGHGHSSHIAPGLAYNIWQDIADIFAIADSLGWQEFNLIGHSRGAIIAALAAGTFPERIKGLGLIDALAPPPISAEDSPAQLAKSIVDVARRQDRATSIFNDADAAIVARQKGMHKISEQAARLIVERGIKPVAGGYTWSSDPRLMSASAFKLSQEQIEAFLGRISASCCLIAASLGLQKYIAKQEGLLGKISNIEKHLFDGGHFLHMEEHQFDIARLMDAILEP